MNIRKSITLGIFLVVMVFALCQGVAMHAIITSAGGREIEGIRKDEQEKARRQLRNYVEMAYHVVETNYNNAHDIDWLQKEYGLALNKIIDLAEAMIVEHKKKVEQGALTQAEAQKLVLQAIGQIRYNQDTGYVWRNDSDQALTRIFQKSDQPFSEGGGWRDRTRLCLGERHGPTLPHHAHASHPAFAERYNPQ